MIDNLTRQLLIKYLPNDPRLKQEPLQTPTAVTKAEALPLHGQVIKKALEASEGLSGMVVIMSSADYSEVAIFKALREFNMANPEYMAYSFTLPVSVNGVPSGSWVFTGGKDDN